MEATRQHSAAPGENHLYIKPSKRMLSSETNVNRDDADWSDRSFGDDKYADLTVKCASREWKVHRVVVCRQCDFFASCCNGQFKKSQERAINLENDDENAVHAMLEYFYTCEFNQDLPTAGSPLALITKVYYLADKYLISVLKTLALRKYKTFARANWASADFANAVADAYQSNPADGDPFFRITSNIVKEHAQEILRSAKDFQDIRQVARSTSRLAFNMAAAVARGTVRVVCYGEECPLGSFSVPATTSNDVIVYCPSEACGSAGWPLQHWKLQ